MGIMYNLMAAFATASLIWIAITVPILLSEIDDRLKDIDETLTKKLQKINRKN